MSFPDHTPRWRRYLRMLRPNLRGDVDDELRFHFDSRIEELISQGMTAAAAQARAAAEFGNLPDVRSHLLSIDQRLAARRGRIDWWRDVGGDLTYAVRSLMRSPAVAIAILVTLGLGVGANAAMFTLIDSIFIRPPAAVVDPGGVRRVWRTIHTRDAVMFWPGYSYVEFSAIKDAIAGRATLAIYAGPQKMRTGSGDGVGDAHVSRAATSYFSLLGQRPQIGRLYSPEEDRLDDPEPVAVLSDDYWKRTFGADRTVIGKSIVIAAQRYTIVGVAQPSFTGIDLDATDMWIPLGSALQAFTDGHPWWRNNNVNRFAIIARPVAGVDPRELEQRMTTALRRPEAIYRALDSTAVARFGSIVQANGPGDQSQEQRIAVRLAGVAIIVLLIACANVVNLLLSRAMGRRREIAVRLALGISRARLIRLLLVESGALAAAAAVVAVAVAYAGGTVLRKLLLPDIHWARSPLDVNAVVLALGISMVAGLTAGLIPALQAANSALTDALKTGSGSGVVQRARLRNSLVAVQTALSVVLLVGAMLFARSLSNVRQVDIGFDARRIVSVTADYYNPTLSKSAGLPQRYAQLAQGIRELPGVEAAELASMAPMSGFNIMTYFIGADSAAISQKWLPTVTGVSAGYFSATGLHFVRGRNFATSGSAAPPEVVVNQTMAKGTWPGGDAVGQCMRFGTRNAPCYRVVGVVDDSRMGDVIEDPMPIYYVPLTNVPAAGAASIKPRYVIVRADPQRLAQLTSATRALVRQDFPGSIPAITWLSEFLEPQYRPWKLGATLFTAFGVLALVVAVVGIYSTVSYGVSQRTHEFGVRIALGAQLVDVVRLVVGEGLRTVAIGIAGGIGLALVAGRFIAALLYGVTPGDPVTISVVTLTLLVVGAAAALIPAWRAARVDPANALRAD